MRSGIVKRNRLIVMFLACPQILPNSIEESARSYCAPVPGEIEARLLLSKFQGMGGDIATFAIECANACDKDPIEHSEQQQRVFGRLAERFSLFD